MHFRVRIQRGTSALAAIASLFAAIWLVGLPRLAEREGLRSEIDRLEARGIDPSAMYYTDLEGMDDVLDGMDRFRREHPRALWIPPWLDEGE